MSQRASRASSASLRGVDLAAVQANLRALGHDVDEGQLLGMLRSIDISEVLGRSARGTPESVARQQAQPSAGSASSASNTTMSQRTYAAEDGENTIRSPADGRSDETRISDGVASMSSLRHSAIGTESYLSDVSADSRSELSFQVIKHEGSFAVCCRSIALDCTDGCVHSCRPGCSGG